MTIYIVIFEDSNIYYLKRNAFSTSVNNGNTFEIFDSPNI